MRLKLLFAMVCISALDMYGQALNQSEWLWNIKVENTSIIDSKPLSFVDKDNNYFMVGSFNGATTSIQGTTLQNTSLPAGTATVGDAFIAKFDENGTFLNVKHFGGSRLEIITSVDYDGDAHYYIAGVFNGTMDLGSGTVLENLDPYATKTFIAKYTLSGTLVWSKVFDQYVGNGYVKYKNDKLYFAANYGYDQLSFDGVTLPVANYSPTIAGMDKNLVARFDASNGALQWVSSSRYTGPYTSISADRIGAQIRTMTVDNNGNVYIAGEFFSRSVTFGSITLNRTSSSNSNLFFVRYDNTGAVAWAKTAATSGGADSKVEDLAVDAANDVYLAGRVYNSSANFDGTILQFPGNYGGFLVKYNTAGSLVWARRAGISSDQAPTTGLSLSRLSKLHIDAQDNVYVGGSFYKYLNLAPNFVYNLSNQFYLLLAKYSKQGVVQSCEIYPCESNGVRDLKVLNSTADNFSVVSDLSIDFQLNNLPIAAEQKNRLYIAKRDVVTAGSEDFDKTAFSVYPNPATESLFVKGIETLDDQMQFSIFDFNGRKISKTEKQTVMEKGIDVSKLAGGVYFLRIEDAKGNVKQHSKFIKNNQ
ncbi:T9SS type A sorting domain-containing protein [Flavobacterium inviolabile]|uniref:T9SS type A sorting domain-containing protein n=1 Tax=Flavobacterium inviolabile TaxID=2748320 RepID=UPI0015AA66CA|nr:T9SS type A sorting domain-containing protein [Flavobacterium inviolabile]